MEAIGIGIGGLFLSWERLGDKVLSSVVLALLAPPAVLALSGCCIALVLFCREVT